MRLSSYLLSAREIILEYKGEVPFAAWLKTYFKQHSKFGSRDRKLVADLCFCFFRLGASFPHHTIEERLLIGQFLCYSQSAFIAQLKPEWQQNSAMTVEEKLRILNAGDSATIFPWMAEVSTEIDPVAFYRSFLQQPDLFLRIRPGNKKSVTEKLDKAKIEYCLTGDCLRLPNSTKVEGVLHMDEEVVVQDLRSQQVLLPLQQHLEAGAATFSMWDCCAASGGKTILFHDRYPAAKLTVSDIRESILFNLKSRLKRAEVRIEKSFVADLSSPQFSFSQTFAVVLCDAPCSGSGTWARTPEQLLFFPPEKIAAYAALQKRIALNAAKCVQKNGYFLYITCSVFAKENEENVADLAQQTGLQLLSQTYLKGYEEKGDTLFVALFKA